MKAGRHFAFTLFAFAILVERVKNDGSIIVAQEGKCFCLICNFTI
jgi:hypothetical protein